MSLRHAVLGLLASHPATGYELTQKFDSSLSHAWHASHSQIYPELGRLAESGFVEVVGEGARGSRTFAITDGGRAELSRWMVEVEPTRTVRNETAVRWFLLFLLPPEEQRVVLERELAHTAAEEAMLRELDTVIVEGGGSPFHPTVTLGLRTLPVMRAWLQEQLDALDG
ncbi:MAG TPA: PadR family transcriptional regulator [Solirubrobacteraceae bacterium]|nr:PadR family transcriptional regulator [Solirubrobacteraceae bacterium]